MWDRPASIIYDMTGRQKHSDLKLELESIRRIFELAVKRQFKYYLSEQRATCVRSFMNSNGA